MQTELQEITCEECGQWLASEQPDGTVLTHPAIYANLNTRFIACPICPGGDDIVIVCILDDL